MPLETSAKLKEVRIALTSRGITLTISLIIFILIYVIHGVIISLALVLLSTTLLIAGFYKVTLYSKCIEEGRAKIRRKTSHYYDAGKPLKVEIVVKTACTPQLNKILVIDYFSPYIRTHNTVRREAKNSSKETIIYSYEVIGRVGINEFKETVLLLCDPLGLYCAQALFETLGEVYGKPPITLAPLPARLKAYTALGVLSRRRGSGTVFYGIRDYNPGDPIRHIDWHHSLKYNFQKLFLKVYEEEATTSILIALFFSNKSFIGEPLEAPFEKIAISIASLIARLSSTSVKLSILISTPHDIISTKFMKGRRLVEETIRILSSIRWPDYEEVFLNNVFKPPLITGLGSRLKRLRGEARASKLHAVFIYHISGFESQTATISRINELITAEAYEARVKPKLFLVYGGPIEGETSIAERIAKSIAEEISMRTSIRPTILSYNSPLWSVLA